MKVVITSGATREHIDPVRFISNISTGNLGSCIADEAALRGFQVIYIHGISAKLPSSPGIQLKEVISTGDVLRLLKENGLQDIVVFGGGIIPDEDIKQLKSIGVAEIFTPGTSTQAIIDWVKTNVKSRSL